MPTSPTSPFLLPLLLFFSVPVLSQSDQFFQYNGFTSAANGTNSTAAISLNGVSEIDASGILRLTNETSRLIGRAFYPSPLRLKNATTAAAASFSTAFAFAIVPEYPKLGGHGMAFAITPTPAPKGLPSQYLGILNASDVGNFSNHAFFVEFDTVQDFEFQDINDNHVGINVNDMRSNYSAAAAYYDDSGTKQDLNLKSGRTIQGWVDYDGVGKILNVTLSPFSTKPETPLLSVPLDLSPILLNDTMFVGFSSSTGLLASSHYLFGWSFRMNGEAPSLDLSALPSLPQPKKKNVALIVGTSVSTFVLLIAAAAVAGYLLYKIRNADVIEPWELHYGPHRFSYKELRKATKGFRDRELLGFGGFGKVYKGVLPRTKAAVAVKRVSHESKQGLREFVAEIASIGRLRHRNLVQLQGWCRRRADLILVYDYMPNGSLDKLLFDPDPAKLILSWAERYKIIRGVASALLYLHEEWEHIVIHRDVKASNILLDADMNGRLGDFGLAKLYEHGTNPSTTRVVGTLGYLAPELTRTGKATTSTDVFAFGALVLEVVCGRRPIEPKALPEELILVDWVWDKLRNEKVAEVVDPRLNGEFRTEEAEVAVKVGLMCSHPASAIRPSMRDVVRYLDGDLLPPDVAMPPEESERSAQVGFEDYVHSYPSSSFANHSNNSTMVVVMDGSETAGDVAVPGRGRFFDPYSPVDLLSS